MKMRSEERRSAAALCARREQNAKPRAPPLDVGRSELFIRLHEVNGRAAMTNAVYRPVYLLILSGIHTPNCQSQIADDDFKSIAGMGCNELMMAEFSYETLAAMLRVAEWSLVCDVSPNQRRTDVAKRK